MKRPVRRKRWLSGILVCLGVLSMTPLFAPPAHAEERWTFPIVAGSSIEVPGARYCTVGAVLRARGMFSQITAFQRGVRYLVIAKHCINDVGSPVRFSGEEIEQVSFVSPSDDIALVKVDPIVRRTHWCSPVSQLHRCGINEESTPRAEGKVLMRTSFGVIRIPVTGSGEPPPRGTFCTSGQTTGVICDWVPAPHPPRPDGFAEGERAARSLSGDHVDSGDSGGPVVSRGGELFGIIVRRGDGPLEGYMGYVPMSRVFATIGSSYELATG